jgi:hypothetical protein
MTPRLYMIASSIQTRSRGDRIVVTPHDAAEFTVLGLHELSPSTLTADGQEVRDDRPRLRLRITDLQDAGMFRIPDNRDAFTTPDGKRWRSDGVDEQTSGFFVVNLIEAL